VGLWPELQSASTPAATAATTGASATGTAEARSKYTQESRRGKQIYQGRIS